MLSNAVHASVKLFKHQRNDFYSVRLTVDGNSLWLAEDGRILSGMIYLYDLKNDIEVNPN